MSVSRLQPPNLGLLLLSTQQFSFAPQFSASSMLCNASLKLTALAVFGKTAAAESAPRASLPAFLRTAFSAFSAALLDLLFAFRALELATPFLQDAFLPPKFLPLAFWAVAFSTPKVLPPALTAPSRLITTPFLLLTLPFSSSPSFASPSALFATFALNTKPFSQRFVKLTLLCKPCASPLFLTFSLAIPNSFFTICLKNICLIVTKKKKKNKIKFNNYLHKSF